LNISAIIIALSGAASARADIAVDFECTIPASSDFDCNILQQRFFKEKALPFFKEKGKALNVASTIKISVGRLPVLNGFDYHVTVTRVAGGTESIWKEKKFLSDGVNPTSAIQQINTVIQNGILSYGKLVTEATVKDKKVIAVFGDPAEDDSKPDAKPEGRWVLKPGLAMDFKKQKDLPSTGFAAGHINFNYSGDRDRIVIGAGGGYNRFQTTIPTLSGPQAFGVSTYSGGGGGMIVTGLDKKNHWNFGSTFGADVIPIQNLKAEVKTAIGLEYNIHPYLKEDSKTLAFGCTIGPSYHAFSVPNVMDKKQFLALEQNCNIAASLLLDKKRGTTVSAKVGQTWIVNAPEYVGVEGTVSANIRLTDRVSLMPSAKLSWKTKEITTASSKYVPSLDGLSYEDQANELFKHQMRASSASTLNYGGDLSISYTFGDGVNRSNQDQRGKSLLVGN